MVLQITNWRQYKVTNGCTAVLNNLIKQIKRLAFGFRNFGKLRAYADRCSPGETQYTTVYPTTPLTRGFPTRSRTRRDYTGDPAPPIRAPSNYRIRRLLYAGTPNWNLPDTVTPH